jgi:cytochrome P450
MTLRIIELIKRTLGRASSPRLPPGERIAIDVAEQQDRQLLLDLTAEHGPIFKGILEGQLGICIVGLSLGKRFLREHADNIQAHNIDISQVVTGGFMRQMQGDVHRRYRRMLMSALLPDGFTVDDDATRQCMIQVLNVYADTGDYSPESWQRALHTLITKVLIHVLLGSAPDSRLGQQIYDAYNKLGPYGLVWNLTGAQITAFAEIRSLLEGAVNAGEINAASLLGRLSTQPDFDATMFGNLIYMTEMGRYDMQTYFRWLSRYAAVDQQALQRARASTSGDSLLMRSFVMEVLRTDQSERLMRRCLADIEFEGFLFPRDVIVRICMWESHHDAEVFPAPLRFLAERFAMNKVNHEQFSPFGLDRHQCPFSEIVIRLASAFLLTLGEFGLSVTGDGAPVRGAYHWEPATEFSLQLARQHQQPH